MSSIIGPCCLIAREGVRLGAGVVLRSHVVVQAGASLGAGCVVHPFAVIGDETETEAKKKEEDTTLRSVTLGNNCVIREHAVLRTGVMVGDGTWILAGALIESGCRLGDNVVVANGARLGKGCWIGNFAVLGGHVVVHPGVRIGQHTMVAGGGVVSQHVLPCTLVQKDDTSTSLFAKPKGINLVGLKRMKFTKEQILNALRAFGFLFPFSKGIFRSKSEFPLDKIVPSIISTKGEDELEIRSRALLDFISVTEKDKVRWKVGFDMANFVIENAEMERRKAKILKPLIRGLSTLARNSSVHPSAFLSKSANIGEEVSIGPYCVVSNNTVIGARTILLSHVVIESNVRIGEDCTVHPFAVIGGEAQDRKHFRAPTPSPPILSVDIGRNCVIRENVTINASTDQSRPTMVGDNTILLAGAHVGHDCVVGKNVSLGGGVQLGGHCVVGNYCQMGQNVLVHQLTNVGHYSFLLEGSAVSRHILPFCSVEGNRARVQLDLSSSLSQLRDFGFTDSQIREGHQALVFLCSNASQTLSERAKEILKRAEEEIATNNYLISLEIARFVLSLEQQQSLSGVRFAWGPRQLKRGFCNE